MDDKTLAERRFDELVAARRAQGRKTYGRGLDHNDEFCWKMMALEEALDMGQYLMAHIVRLEAEIAERHTPEIRVTSKWDNTGAYQLAMVDGAACQVTYDFGSWCWKVSRSGQATTETGAKLAAEAAARGER